MAAPENPMVFLPARRTSSYAPRETWQDVLTQTHAARTGTMPGINTSTRRHDRRSVVSTPERNGLHFGDLATDELVEDFAGFWKLSSLRASV
jgi:hypothetical protein